MTTQRRPTALQSVACLECSSAYSKPVGGGTIWANPGCPQCGYVGWMPVSGSVRVTGAARRVAGRRSRVLVALSR